MAPLLEAENLTVHFRIERGPGRGRVVRAVQGLDLQIDEGETLGIVGESGCGKSTLARAIVGLVEITSGTLRFRGDDVTRTRSKDLRRLRREIRMVFQDAHSAMNPRRTVGEIVGGPMRIHRRYPSAEIGPRVRNLFELVGLDPDDVFRFPHEFSGGQRQRVGIARALALDPALLVLDEPASSLDVSVQAQILLLLRDLQRQLGVSYLFISHDLAVVRHIAARVAVMYLGSIVECGPWDAIFEQPRHPYTQALLSAVPQPDPARGQTRGRILLKGELPDPADPPSGCHFRTRCWRADERCAEIRPPLVGEVHRCACHYPQTDRQRRDSSRTPRAT